MTELLTRAALWLKHDPDADTRAELDHLVVQAQANDPDLARAAEHELASAFAGPLQFGTAGLRGALGPGPARMNRVVVTQAAAGFAAWLKEQGLGGGKVIVGHDARYNSDVFALDTAEILGGVLLNQKLNPAALENESDRQKLMLLLRTFFEVHKGWHVQYNIVSRETLLAAKAPPDQYRDLVVRVAGYSAFFTALSPEAQDDIINRTEHQLS